MLRKTSRKTGNTWRSRKLLPILMVAVLIAILIGFYYVFTLSRVDKIKEEPKALSILSEASLTCDYVEIEGNQVYLSGTCTVIVNVQNNENETIIVHGIALFYDATNMRVSIPVANVTVEPAQSRTISGSFALPERVLVYDGSNVFMKVFLRITYSGRYYSLLVEPLHIDV